MFTTTDSPSRFRTRGRSRRARLASLLFATTVAIGAVGGQPGPASAAASTGSYSPGYAACNYRYHTLTAFASAAPAAGYASQTVYYRFWVYDATSRGYVASLNPTGWGTIDAWSYVVTATGMRIYNQGTTNSVWSPTYQLTAGHRYQLVTEYWWLTGGVWSSVATTTGSYEMRGYAWDSGNGNMVQVSCAL